MRRQAYPGSRAVLVGAAATVAAATFLGAGAVSRTQSTIEAPRPRFALAQGGTPVLPTPTPLVVPILTPGPIYLPELQQGFDPQLPGPVEARAEGWMAALTERGRQACAPATHVLLRDPEGSTGNVAHAVLFAAQPDPELTLDLYVGEYVELSGTSQHAPPDCDVVTWRSIAVGAIREKEIPPR